MKLTSDQQNEIIVSFTNPKNPTAFGSIPNFKQYLLAQRGLDVPLDQLRALLLRKVPAISIEKPARWHFQRRVHLTSSIDALWAAGATCISP